MSDPCRGHVLPPACATARSPLCIGPLPGRRPCALRLPASFVPAFILPWCGAARRNALFLFEPPAAAPRMGSKFLQMVLKSKLSSAEADSAEVFVPAGILAPDYPANPLAGEFLLRDPLSGEPLSGASFSGESLPGDLLPGEPLPGSDVLASGACGSGSASSGFAPSDSVLPNSAPSDFAPSGSARPVRSFRFCLVVPIPLTLLLPPFPRFPASPRQFPARPTFLRSSGSPSESIPFWSCSLSTGPITACSKLSPRAVSGG